MPLSESAPGSHPRRVDESPALPLAQQILGWLFSALGYEPETKGPDSLSASTLKHARRGRMIRRSWRSLVEQACRILKLSKTAPEMLPKLLRQWDGYVSSLRTLPLDLEDRLLPIMRLALPGLGVRLGAAMALASVVKGQPVGEWEWMRDPLCPGVFRTVLRLVLGEFQPGWETWKGRSKERGRIRQIQPKTIRRWDGGDVPGPQNISTLVDQIGPGSEMWLRWARVAMVARRDLEGWVGKEAVDSWRQAVSVIAMRIGPTLATDPRAIPRLAELWAESLAIAPDLELAEHLAGVLGLVEPSITPETVQSWLLDISANSTALPSDSKQVRALLLLSVLLPHPRLVAATQTHLTQDRALLMASADFRTLLGAEWSLRAGLRAVERGEPMQRLSPGGGLEAVTMTEPMREAAHRLLREYGRFIRRHDVADESPVGIAEQTLLAPLFGLSSEQYSAALSEAEESLPYVMLDSRAEMLLPTETVRELPKLALARARRLATSGEVPTAMAALKAIDLSAYEPDASERTDLAAILSELAHHALDQVYGCLRLGLAELRSAGLLDDTQSPSVLGALLAESMETILVQSDRLIDAAVRWVAPQHLKTPQIEALALSFPYQLRRERLLGALGRSSPGTSNVGALVECLIEHAERFPNDGEVIAMLALARDFECAGSECVPNDVGHRSEHLGTTTLRDNWLTRIRRDLKMP